MNRLYFSLLLAMFLSCQAKQETSESETPITIDVSEDIVIPKSYIVCKSNDAIVIDGKAKENSWHTAAFTDSFIDIEGEKDPYYETKVKMLWDDDFLYVYAELIEEHIWGDIKEKDQVIFYNNDFEVFIDPSGEARNYGEIEINALGTVWDLLLDKPYRVGGKAKNNWNISGLQTAVSIQGSLNNPSDIDSMWTVEMAIPLWSMIEIRNKPRTIPQEGEQWRINFSRVQWQHEIVNNQYQRKREGANLLREDNWVWSNQKVINMHEPEKWGVIQFTTNSTSSNVTYAEDSDMEIKQVLFALFRITRFGEFKYLQENEVGYSCQIEANYGNEKTIFANFLKTHFGFEITLKSPVSSKNYSINQEGYLKSIE
jgi:hypothetical protein